MIEIEAGDPVSYCPDCKGTGQYVGFVKVETCTTCLGRGIVPSRSERTNNDPRFQDPIPKAAR